MTKKAIDPDLLNDLIEYFDNKADGETIDGREVLNQEARFLQALREYEEC